VFLKRKEEKPMRSGFSDDRRSFYLPKEGQQALYKLARWHGWKPKVVGLNLSEHDLQGLDEEDRRLLIEEAQRLKEAGHVTNSWADFSCEDSMSLAAALRRALPCFTGAYRDRWNGDLNEEIILEAIAFFEEDSCPGC